MQWRDRRRNLCSEFSCDAKPLQLQRCKSKRHTYRVGQKCIVFERW